jgi:hypothetical protein
VNIGLSHKKLIGEEVVATAWIVLFEQNVYESRPSLSRVIACAVDSADSHRCRSRWGMFVGRDPEMQG